MKKLRLIKISAYVIYEWPLSINAILDKFREDIKDPQFLSSKIKQHFLNNNHRLTLTMSPQSDYLVQQKKQLDELEADLIMR